MATLAQLRQIESDILATGGKIDSDTLRVLQGLLFAADGSIDRQNLDALVDLRRRLQRPANPAFGNFFATAVKKHVLRDGRIGAEEAAWLRQLVFADGAVQDEERTLLKELRGEAKGGTSPEFDALFAEVEKHPPERRTSDGGRDADHHRRK